MIRNEMEMVQTKLRKRSKFDDFTECLIYVSTDTNTVISHEMLQHALTSNFAFSMTQIPE